MVFRRGQVALEFLTTYGWAFLVVLVMIGALSHFGVLDPGSLAKRECVSEAGFGCESSLVTDSSQRFSFRNNLGTDVVISGATATIKSTGDVVNCGVPSGTISYGDSFELVCDGGLIANKRENLDINFKYYPADGSSAYAKDVRVSISDKVVSNVEFVNSGGSGGGSNNYGLAWGYNNVGQLGDGSNTQRLTPVSISGAPNLIIVAAGYHHSCGVLVNGSAVCWGEGDNGRLGRGSNTDSLVPVFVSGNYLFKDISAGTSHSCGVLVNGSAMCWGQNNYGLGDGVTTTSNVPIFVTGFNSFDKISVGDVSSCGLLTNSSVVCWGYNAGGALGNGNNSNSQVPVFVSGGHSFSNISAGRFHFCGILSNGSAVCWGANSNGLGANGRLGDGTSSNSNIPVFVSGNYLFKDVNGGSLHSCGVLVNGSAMCWGEGDNGRLGRGSNTDSLVPVFVSGGYAFKSIAASEYHSCGVLVNGSAVCWGFNSNGRLGDGTTTSSTIPVFVTGITNAKKLTLGNAFSLAHI